LGFVALKPAGCELVLATDRNNDQVIEALSVATTYPLSARYYCSKLGYEITRVKCLGGRIEGKHTTGKYNAIFDIKHTGKTLEQNNLKVIEKLGYVSMGLVFRKEEYDPNDYVFEEWQLRQVLETIMCRKVDIVRGRMPNQRTKNTGLLLSNENQLVKAIGEESAEFIRAVLREEGMVNETADNLYTTFVANTRVGTKPVAAFNELFRRNQKPTLRLE
jgi:ATP phosphoribosyltransferase